MSRIEETKIYDKETGELIAEHTQEQEQNRNFVQLYRHHIEDIARLGSMDALALKIWLWIVERMGRDNALVCSMVPLVEHFKKSRQTISGKIGFLEKSGFLQVAKMGNTNVYLVNADIVWTADANGKRYAEFRGAIVIAESEQTKPVPRKPKSRKIVS